MLAAFIEERHDYCYSVCLACTGLYHALKVLIMVVRRHMVLVTKHIVGNAVVTYINEDINIQSSYSVGYCTFCLSASKTGANGINMVRIPPIA